MTKLAMPNGHNLLNIAGNVNKLRIRERLGNESLRDNNIGNDINYA